MRPVPVPQPSRGQWQIAFYIAGGIYVVGALTFALLASGDEQPWAASELLQAKSVSSGRGRRGRGRGGMGEKGGRNGRSRRAEVRVGREQGAKLNVFRVWRQCVFGNTRGSRRFSRS